ncbi:MAG: hypothetical protein NPIRA04_22810 [Nitrospirales bacterium]|nr:MAG: hypothetical protein NPIRA04_22810 [Nitrospirales bacterium]
MTSPFLPIFTNPQAVALGNSESGKSGSAIEPSGQGEGHVAFSDVLGGIQQMLPENEQSSLMPFEDQSLLLEAILYDPDIVDELASQGLILTEQHGTFSFQLVSAGSVNGLPIQHSLDVLQSYRNTSVKTGLQGDGQAVVDQVQAILSRLRSLGSTASQIVSSIQENVVRQVAEPSSDLSIPVLNLSRVKESAGAVSQAVDSGELRVRPLLNELSQSVLAARPSPVSAATAFADSNVNAQRLVPAVEGVGVNPQTIVETLASGTRLPASHDELTQGLTRVESENKLLGSLSASQGTESHSGHSGTGLPFGHHAGTGQGQLFDTTSSNLVSTSQVQIVAKGGSFDERLQLLNTAVPHRLQIDVQLSEASRVQVDVGVAQRQVYAGVLLDNPVLRALASQNVQSLEDQLGRADMELEEFDVHEENQPLDEQSDHERFREPGSEGRILENVGNSMDSHEMGNTRIPMSQGRNWHMVA